jgi:hypothetical protein
MNYARIENDVVMEVIKTDKDISSLYAPDLIWVICEDSVKQRQLYISGEFHPEPDIQPSTAPTLVEQILSSPADLAALKQALGAK